VRQPQQREETPMKKIIKKDGLKIKTSVKAGPDIQN